MVHITKKDLDKDNYYKDSGINTEEEITCDENLGYIKFKKSVITTKSIILGLGSGIKAGCGIKAGYGIEAGCGIEAGDGIEAGNGIEAGLSIICKGILKFSYQLFAGTCTWRKTTEEDLIVECGKLDADGEIILGNLKETGNIPEEIDKIKIIDGKKYKLVEDALNVGDVA